MSKNRQEIVAFNHSALDREPDGAQSTALSSREHTLLVASECCMAIIDDRSANWAGSQPISRLVDAANAFKSVNAVEVQCEIRTWIDCTLPLNSLDAEDGAFQLKRLQGQLSAQAPRREMHC